LKVRLSISVGVAEREDSAGAGSCARARRGAATARSPRIDEDITVRCDDDMSGPGRSVGEDGGAETVRQLESRGASRGPQARWQSVLGLSGSSENTGEQKCLLHGNHPVAGVVCWGNLAPGLSRVERRESSKADGTTECGAELAQKKRGLVDHHQPAFFCRAEFEFAPP
jgi:hypothetical protein